MIITYGPGRQGPGEGNDKYRAAAAGKAAVALGFFDGVHKGHRALLEETRRISVLRGIRSVVYTFVNHPLTVLGADVKLLCSNRLRANYIAESGVDELRFVWFDREMSRMAPEDFARKVLAEELNAEYVLTGENYTFGAGGSGNAELLSQLGRRYGFESAAVPSVKCELDGKRETVSSSLLRKLASTGRMGKYETVAGHRFRLEGVVAHGREVGRSMDFPTANMVPDRRSVLPASGVYATAVRISGDPDNVYLGITNVGKNPTFKDTDGRTSIETNLLDFEGDLYGRPIMVEFIEKTRDEKRFSSQEELRDRLVRDASERKKLFEARGI